MTRGCLSDGIGMGIFLVALDGELTMEVSGIAATACQINK